MDPVAINLEAMANLLKDQMMGCLQAEETPKFFLNPNHFLTNPPYTSPQMGYFVSHD
jgi:hypothetical protein